MKNIYIAIGCLILMQTSAFSLKFNNDMGEKATVMATDFVELSFTKTLTANNPSAEYKPQESSVGQDVVWTVGNKRVPCTLPHMKTTLSDGYQAMLLENDTPKGCSVHLAQ